MERGRGGRTPGLEFLCNEGGEWRCTPQRRVKGKKALFSRRETTRCWWLTPIILATWEAEIRRIVVQGQARKIDQETLY
jgi:hypothetical protein